MRLQVSLSVFLSISMALARAHYYQDLNHYHHPTIPSQQHNHYSSDEAEAQVWMPTKQPTAPHSNKFTKSISLFNAPHTNPLRPLSPLTSTTGFKGEFAGNSNGGIEGLAPAQSIFAPTRPVATIIPGQVSYYYNPVKQYLYQVTRIALGGGPSLHHNTHQPTNFRPQTFQNPAHYAPITTTTTIQATPPTSPPPTPVPPTNLLSSPDLSDRRRKKYKFKFELVLDDTEGEGEERGEEGKAAETGTGALGASI